MIIRREARIKALQFLYAFEHSSQGTTFEDAERAFICLGRPYNQNWEGFPRDLAALALLHRKQLDADIQPLLQKKWSFERLPSVDRLCLRLALCELRYFPEIPLRVTIDEYLELARAFSEEASTQYINAVLDQLSKAHPEKDFHSAQDPQQDERHTVDTEAIHQENTKRSSAPPVAPQDPMPTVEQILAEARKHRRARSDQPFIPQVVAVIDPPKPDPEELPITISTQASKQPTAPPLPPLAKRHAPSPQIMQKLPKPQSPKGTSDHE